MSGLQFFRSRYKDAVVEYYFHPLHGDIRLTVRFGLVLVHRQFIDAASGNRCWLQEPVSFPDICWAERYALSLVASNATTMYEKIAGPTTRVCEARDHYHAA
jgi:hypothetical protein